WARRPLTDEQLDYLHRDTAYLPGLRERFSARLREADLEEEAGIEFRRLAAREGKPVAFDPEGWRRIKGAGRLDAVGRAILSRLHVWREREAERRDVPPFKVLSPRTMHALAAHPPTDTRGTQALSAVGPRERRRYGNAILAALREGRRLAAEGRAPGKPARPRLPREEMVRRGRERKREDALRRWRRAEAEAREVPPLVVLPNPALQWIVRERPRDVDALAAHPDVGNKRAARYGRAILETLNGTG
ncbi:MAG: HRDC domain-containing protein, partial [Planctomycetota bacterium]